MAELRMVEGDGETTGCCSPAAQESCCELEAKGECCGPEHEVGTCGCGAAKASGSQDVRRVVRKRLGSRRRLSA